MKVIIVGSKGFIGSHLYNYLNNKEYQVWGADIINNANSKDYFLLDPTDTDFDKIFQHTEYCLCINCSGAASVSNSIINPFMDYRLNVINVFKILDGIRKYQPGCKFINLSSAAVYGNPEKNPVNESSPINALSPYGIHKFQAEQICKEFYDVYNIQTDSLRIFSVYGPGLKRQLFWDIYNKVSTGLPLKLYGTGNESRDFIYIDDLVRAIEIVFKFSDFKADVINIANGEEIRIKDAVSYFLRFFNNNITYTFSGISRDGDPINWHADINRLKSLGYQPSVDINSGLQKYYEWIRNSIL